MEHMQVLCYAVLGQHLLRHSAMCRAMESLPAGKEVAVLQPLPRPPARHTKHAQPGPGALPARLLLLHVGSTHSAPLRPAEVGRREVLCQLSAFGAFFPCV